MSTAVAAEGSVVPVVSQMAPQGRGRRSPRLLLASMVLVAPGWLEWAFNGHRGTTSAVGTSAILAVNAVATRLLPALKLRVVRVVQRYALNPAIRAVLMIGVLPLGISVLETTGRRSGKPRRNPVGEGRIGETFWIVAEHGREANYVRNITSDPQVRVKIRRRLRSQWRDGTAHVLEHDDPYRRQRQLCRRHPLRALHAALVRVWGTDLITIRIDLAPADRS
jgi:deazaflavin-dependent oxidoreductase (nitroreductase family)